MPSWNLTPSRAITITRLTGPSSSRVSRRLSAGCRCRNGLLSADDLSGRPVLLELAPENKAQSLAPERRASKDSRGTILYRVADMVNCRLMDGNREIAQSRLPLYQFGQVIELPVTSVK